MKNHSRIIFVMAACLAGFIGQSGAFAQTTNSVWNVTTINALSAGSLKRAETNSGTAVFLSDGTCSFSIGTNEVDATYTSTTKSLTIILGPSASAALASNTFDFATSEVPGVTVVISKVGKLSKIKLLDGVPVKATDKISGKGSITISGKTKSKSFSVTDSLIDWTLSSGTSF